MMINNIRTYIGIPENVFFLKKALIVSLISIVVVVTVMELFTSRFYIYIDPQTDRCLPDKRVYLVDKTDKIIIRGEKYAFAAKNLQSYILDGDPRISVLADHYKDGEKMLKIVDGIPGDKVSISQDENKINDLKRSLN